MGSWSAWSLEGYLLNDTQTDPASAAVMWECTDLFPLVGVCVCMCVALSALPLLSLAHSLSVSLALCHATGMERLV